MNKELEKNFIYINYFLSLPEIPVQFQLYFIQNFQLQGPKYSSNIFLEITKDPLEIFEFLLCPHT